MRKVDPTHLTLLAIQMLTVLAFACSAMGQASNQVGPVPPSKSSVIEWELVNPFPFIRDQNMIDELKQTYRSLEQKSAYNLQRALQALDEARTKRRREIAAARFDCGRTRNFGELFECYAPFSGWFAPLAVNNYSGTCWDAARRRFRRDGVCKEYIHPTKHRIRAWIEGPQRNQSGGQWSLDGVLLNQNSNPKGSPCSLRYMKNICVEFDLPYDKTEQKAHSISYAATGDEPIKLPLKVVDRLVVGLGDSFAAGEGNPDSPARFVAGRLDGDRVLTALRQVAPRKDAGGRAAWLDRRCHRSMYSYQFQTALLLALKYPKAAVTFVSYSCTGATTPDIIDKKQGPGEGWGFLNKVPAQLRRLRRVLADKRQQARPIDYLLLSTGGNDADFSKFVADVVIAKNLAKRLPRMLKLTKEPTPNTADEVRKLLIGTDSRVGNYEGLHRTLLGHPKTKVTIKTCENGGPCSRIFLNVYPTLLKDENEQVCKGEHEFDQSFWKDPDRAFRIGRVQEWVAKPLRDIQLTDLGTLNLGWRIVTGHLPEFERHGFCAGVKNGEAARIPIRQNDRWTPIEPRDYNTYGIRDRWVKIPVDAKLTSDQTRRLLWFEFEFALEDDRSSIIHPTWEGLAAMADANLAEIQNVIDEEHQRAIGRSDSVDHLKP